jgi:hypothetical protein
MIVGLSIFPALRIEFFKTNISDESSQRLVWDKKALYSPTILPTETLLAFHIVPCNY